MLRQPMLDACTSGNLSYLRTHFEAFNLQPDQPRTVIYPVKINPKFLRSDQPLLISELYVAAVRAKHLDVLSLLQSVFPTYDPGIPVIRAAVETQDTVFFHAFMRRYPSIIDSDLDGCTTLEAASWKPNTQLVALLLAGGADPNMERKARIGSAMTFAVNSGHPFALFEKFVACGAKVDDSWAINAAFERGRADVLKLLFEHGANPRCTDHQRKMLLQRAREKRQGEMVALLERAEREYDRRQGVPWWKRLEWWRRLKRWIS